MRLPRTLAPMVVLACGCRIGGPSADPQAYLEFPSDASDAADGASAVSGDDSASDVGLADQTAPKDVSVEATDARDAADSSDAPAGDGEGGDAAECMPPASVPVCNPIGNTGCILAQCDVDTTQMTPTGICVAALLNVAENQPCTQTAGSTPCQAGLTCFGGTCKKVCFCNSDCPVDGGVAECCSATLGTTGFKLCGACN